MVKVETEVQTVMHIASVLCYDGLNEDMALRIVGSMDPEELKLLVFTLVKMIEKFEGRRA